MAEQFQNSYVSKLREACQADSTTIYVETVPTITEGKLVLDFNNSNKYEIIRFTGVSGYGLTGCVRGLEGTVAKQHVAGSDVRQNLTAGMLADALTQVNPTEGTGNKIEFSTATTKPAAKDNIDIIWFEPRG